MLNKPFFFQPIYVEKMWGGDRFHTLFGRPSHYEKTGESWEISAVPQRKTTTLYESKNIDIYELMRHDPNGFWGTAYREDYLERFPLLIKYIDASQKLSLQVHPDDSLARQYQSKGKSECWYILYADPGAEVIAGFQRSCSDEELHRINDIPQEELRSLLRFELVKEGDFLYIPAGTVHAILGGVLIAEIQQSSDITYRLSDWNRVGLDGHPRELHLEQGVAAINGNDTEPHLYRSNQESGQTKLLSCPYFDVDQLCFYESTRLSFQSMRILLNVGGSNVSLTVNGAEYPFPIGSTVLLPAACEVCDLSAINDGPAVVLTISC